MLQKGIKVNVRLTDGTQDIPLGAGTWNIVLFIRSTSVTVTGTVLGATDQAIDVLGTLIIDASVAGLVTDGATAVTGNKMVRFLSASSGSVTTGHLNAMDSTVTLVDKIRITIASATDLVECTLIATRVA